MPSVASGRLGCGYWHDAPPRPVLAAPCPENDHTSQGCPATYGVDNRRTREIGESDSVQPAPTPLPRGLDRIDQQRHDGREHEERADSHPLGDGTGDNGSSRGTEHQLEEEVRSESRVRDVFRFGGRTGPGKGSPVDGSEHSINDPAVARIHEVVRQNEVCKARNRIDANSLEALCGGISCADEPRFEHRETRSHPHDKKAANQEQKAVEYKCGFLWHSGRVLGHSHPRRGQQRAERRNRGEFANHFFVLLILRQSIVPRRPGAPPAAACHSFHLPAATADPAGPITAASRSQKRNRVDAFLPVQPASGPAIRLRSVSRTSAQQIASNMQSFRRFASAAFGLSVPHASITFVAVHHISGSCERGYFLQQIPPDFR